MVKTNNINKVVLDNQLEEFNYFNNDYFTHNNFTSPSFLNDNNLVDTITSIIGFENIEHSNNNTQSLNTDVNDSSDNSHRESSVVSEIWDNQNILERHHPSITTIDSNNEPKFENCMESQIQNEETNQNRNICKIAEPKEKVIDIAETNFEKLHSYFNQQTFDVKSPNILDEFSRHDVLLTSVNPVQLSTTSKYNSKNTSENFTTNKIGKTPVNCKAMSNKTMLLKGLNSTQLFTDEFNDTSTDDFLSFHNANNKDSFDNLFSNTSHFESIDFNSICKMTTKSTEAHQYTDFNTPSYQTVPLKESVVSETITDSEEEQYKKQITETSDWLDTNAQRIYEASSDEENATEFEENNILSKTILPTEMFSIDDLPKLELAKHKCDGCFKVNKVSYGCSKQLVKRLPNIDAFKEYNSPNKYTLKYAIQEGNPTFRYVNSEVKTRYDPSIKRYSTKVLYSSKGKKLKRDYPSLCPFCKVSESKSFDSLFYERNNSCYRGHLINTHGINSTGERAKLPKSGFVCYKLGKNSWSETVGFKCPYQNCNQCFLKGDKTHGFHEYIRHWNRFHISTDRVN